MESNLGGSHTTPERYRNHVLQLLSVVLGCLLYPGSVLAQPTSIELDSLAAERELLTAELQQIQKTIALLQGGVHTPDSSNPAFQKLNDDVVHLKQQLIQVSEREIALLQRQIEAPTGKPGEQDTGPEIGPDTAIESKPLSPTPPADSAQAEAERVSQLHRLLRQHHSELEESRHRLPTPGELVARDIAQRDAARLAMIPYNAKKVRLSGAEGKTALATISQRLADPGIPESPRDNSPLCSIRTYLFGSLIASEQRSLTPVGKHHYVTKIHLQPGDTTVRVQAYRWDITLPEDMHTSEYLVTLYQPPGTDPEFHLFSVDELLSLDNPYIPAWLPEELGIRPTG